MISIQKTFEEMISIQKLMVMENGNTYFIEIVDSIL